MFHYVLEQQQGTIYLEMFTQKFVRVLSGITQFSSNISIPEDQQISLFNSVSIYKYIIPVKVDPSRATKPK